MAVQALTTINELLYRPFCSPDATDTLLLEIFQNGVGLFQLMERLDSVEERYAPNEFSKNFDKFSICEIKFSFFQLHGKNDRVFAVIYNKSYEKDGIELKISSKYIIGSSVPSYIPTSFYCKRIFALSRCLDNSFGEHSIAIFCRRLSPCGTDFTKNEF